MKKRAIASEGHSARYTRALRAETKRLADEVANAVRRMEGMAKRQLDKAKAAGDGRAYAEISAIDGAFHRIVVGVAKTALIGLYAALADDGGGQKEAAK